MADLATRGLPEGPSASRVRHHRYMSRAWHDRVVALVSTLLQLVRVQPGAGAEPSPVTEVAGSLLAIAGGAALLARRSRPTPVMVTVAALHLVQVLLLGPVLPVLLIIAAYSSARHGPPVRGTVVALSSSAVALAALVLTGDASIVPLYASLVLVAVLAGALGAAGSARVASMAREAVAEERLRLARDLHDIVGHGMTAINVQAGAARMALDAGAEEQVRIALGTIEQASQDVLREARWLVGLIRDNPPRPSLDDLPRLIDLARRNGLDVGIHVDEAAPSCPTATQEAAYRIVEEALTNVLRHSTADRATVKVELADEMRVEVRDFASPTGSGAGEPTVGNGVRGMRERAAAVGGELWAGPDGQQGGWIVSARFPLPPGRRGRER